jgi:3-oxoacyl-[acyl-carrier-protein] synthase-3
VGAGDLVTSGHRLLTAAGDLSRAAGPTPDQFHGNGNGAERERTHLRAAPITDPSAMRACFSVAGWGTALPRRRVSNQDLARNLDTTDEWITSRSGIRERRISDATETTGKLALDAAERALAHSGVEASEIDLVVVATATPEQPIPSTAAGLSTALGITAGAFDLNAACAGFVYGLVVVGSMIESGVARRVLLVGADTLTRAVDPADRGTAVLFGDGAAALVLVAGDEARGPRGARRPARPGAPVVVTDDLPGGLLASDLVDDPEGVELLTIAAGGSAHPASLDTLAAGDHFLRMDGREVFRRAVRAVTDSVLRTLDRAGCTPADVDLFVPHQANARIIDAVVTRVGLPAETAVQTVDRHGNTSAASVPLAFSEVADAGRLRDGSLVLTTGFGAGLTVGTSLLRWRSSRET